MFSQKTESTNKSPFNNVEGNTVSEKRPERQMSLNITHLRLINKIFIHYKQYHGKVLRKSLL